MIQTIQNSVIKYFEDVDTALKSKDTSNIIYIILPIFLTILIISVFKIKVWKPTTNFYNKFRTKYFKRKK